MRLLKLFVIVTGVLIVAGTGLLVYLIVQRGIGSQQKTVTAPIEAEIDLPDGASVEQVTPGSERHVVLGVAPSGRRFLLTVDAVNGRRLSLLWLDPDR